MPPTTDSSDDALNEAQGRAKALYDELEALEAQAGIAEKTKRAREGSFIPLGALGDKCTPEEYFANEYDYTRRHIRAAYFEVEDAELRKALIAKTLESDKAADEAIAISTRRDINEARRQLESARRYADRTPWVQALTAIVFVAIGWKLFKTPGAIAGAIAAYFLGNGEIRRSEVRRDELVKQSESDLRAALDQRERDKDRPAYFTLQEARTGIRDQYFENESAWGNVLQRSRSATDAKQS